MWDDDDDDYDEDQDYDEAGFQGAAFDIRSLSYAIWSTAQHHFREDAPSPFPSDPGTESLMELFRAFATLLTRNSRTQLVAVTGDEAPGTHATHILGLVPSPPHPHAPPEDLGSWSVLSYQDIAFSESATLPAYSLQSAQVSDSEHAQHVLNIISVFCDTDSTNKGRFLQRALQYIVLQCWAEVASRLAASTQIFAGAPFLAIMRGWQPADEDKPYLQSTWIPIENKGAVLRLRNAQVPTRHGVPAQFLLTWSTAHRWFRALIETLDSLFSCGHRFSSAHRRGSDVQKIVENMVVLSSLLRSSGITQVFQLPSLQSYFMSFSEQGHQRSRLQDRLDYTMVDDERRNTETPGEHVERYLTSLTSWHAAIINVTGAYSHPALSLPSIRLVFCSRPFPVGRAYRKYAKVLMPRLTANTQNVLDYLHCHCHNENSDQEHLTEYWADIFDHLFKHERNEYLDFEDTAHTEALLMDFVAQACSEGHGEHFDVFTPCHRLRVIGIPTQHTMCYCCHFLESILLDPVRHGERLRSGLSLFPERTFSNAFSGHLQPWCPPRLFTNSMTLDAVRGALYQLFAEMVKEYRADSTPIASPHLGLHLWI